MLHVHAQLHVTAPYAYRIRCTSVAVDIVSKTLTVDSAKTDDDEYREYAT